MDLSNLPIEELAAGGLGALNFTPSGILSGLIFGIVGMWMFREGKRRQDFKIICIAVALMFYPYFTRGPLEDWGAGVLLCALAYYYW